MSAPCPILGFVVTVTLADPGDQKELASIAADFTDQLEGNGLSTSGPRIRRDGHVSEYVVQRDGSQATDEDRAFVRAWAARWSGRATVDVSDLIDLNRTA